MRKRLEASRKGRNYPVEMRDAVVEYAEEQRRRGFKWTEIASELGLHQTTIRYWQKANKPVVGALARVSVAADPVPPRCELVVECGALRIRGLDMAQLIELARGLR